MSDVYLKMQFISTIMTDSLSETLTPLSQEMTIQMLIKFRLLLVKAITEIQHIMQQTLQLIPLPLLSDSSLVEYVNSKYFGKKVNLKD